MKYYMGIDIGGTKCAVVIGNENADILKKVSFPTGGVDETLNRSFLLLKLFQKSVTLSLPGSAAADLEYADWMNMRM